MAERREEDSGHAPWTRRQISIVTEERGISLAAASRSGSARRSNVGDERRTSLGARRRRAGSAPLIRKSPPSDPLSVPNRTAPVLSSVRSLPSYAEVPDPRTASSSQ